MRRCSVLLLIVGSLLAPARAGASTGGAFVALGDSYAAGPLIPKQIAAAGLCLRSDHNYAHLLAPAVGATVFRDATCSGATATEMAHTQQLFVGSNPAQLTRVTADARVVTLQIGGNDIGFVSILLHCASLVPWAAPCTARYVRAGRDAISDAIVRTAPRIGGVIDAIHARAPRARVVVLGYPAILPNTGGGCWPRMPVTARDVAYLRAKEKQLDAAIAGQARAHRALYVDVYIPSIGHDACANPATRWVEPVVPQHAAAPVHPNAAGERAFAALIRRALGL